MTSENKTQSIHSWVNIDPANYGWIVSYSTKPPRIDPHNLDASIAYLEMWRSDMAKHSAKFVGTKYPSLSRCDCCGAHMIYGNIFSHTSGEWVKLGETCADNVELHDSRRDLAQKRLRDRAKSERDSQKRLEARRITRRELIEELKGSLEFRVAFKIRKRNEFIYDLLWKRIQGYKWTDRQEEAFYEAAEKQVAFHDKKQIELDEREAKLATAPNLTESRQSITGKVVGKKWKSDDWGCTLKIIVELSDGNRVWGTAPAKVLETIDEEDGVKVTFTAAVTPSDNDPHFGFFKRPTKASLIY
jgi:hypothetical protein